VLTAGRIWSASVSTQTAPTSWRERYRRSPFGHGPLRGATETILLIVVAICLALVVKTFFAQAFYIPSGSMEPGLQGGPGTSSPDRILVEKPSYWFGSPQRGDIVVFSDPGGWLSAEDDAGPTSGLGRLFSKIGLYPSGGHLVKRVIGVGGDTVHCCSKSGEIMINGKAIDETSFIEHQSRCDGPMTQDDGTSAGGGCDGWTAHVPAGRLFVMGDNRANSADSSYHLCSPSRLRQARSDPALARRCADAYVPESDVVGKVVTLMWPASRFKILHRPAVFSTVPNP
jgi:signal peptidase I